MRSPGKGGLCSVAAEFRQAQEGGVVEEVEDAVEVELGDGVLVVEGSLEEGEVVGVDVAVHIEVAQALAGVGDVVEVEVDLGAILRNLETIRSVARDGVGVIAVVKAEASKGGWVQRRI